MKCPACNGTLAKTMAETIEVEVCDGGCGGIWFDNHELPKLDNACEAAGEMLLDLERDPAVTVDHDAPRVCPQCMDQPMMRNFASPRREVEVDECPACGGVWLDAGELGRIRDQHHTEEDRDAAFKSYFDETFGEEIARMLAESGEQAKRAERFARILRFVCPSSYIPGKQSWGAF